MIGDGASDHCVAAQADLTFARKGLLAHCVEHGLAHVAVADFASAVTAWRRLGRVAEARPAVSLGTA